MARKTDFERFDAMVDKAGSCWIWTGAKTDGGYGQFKYSGRNGLAHRFSYELSVGAIPVGLVVMHSCDVRACVNPNHLSVGTHKDNVRDMIEKGRHAHGGSHHASKLSASDIEAIRRDGRSQKEIGKTYGISQAHASKVLKGVVRKRPSFKIPSKRKITIEQFYEIRASRETAAILSAKHGLSISRVNQIRQGIDGRGNKQQW